MWNWYENAWNYSLDVASLLLVICLLVSCVGAVSVSTGPTRTIPCRLVHHLVPCACVWIYRATIRYPATSDGQPQHQSIHLQHPVPLSCVAKRIRRVGKTNHLDPKSSDLLRICDILCFNPTASTVLDTSQWASGLLAGFSALQKQNERRFSPISGILDERHWERSSFSMGGGGCVEATGTAGFPHRCHRRTRPGRVFLRSLPLRGILQYPDPTPSGDRGTDWSHPDHVPGASTPDSLTNNTIKEYLSITWWEPSRVHRWAVRLSRSTAGASTIPQASVSNNNIISPGSTSPHCSSTISRHLDEYYTYIFGEEAPGGSWKQGFSLSSCTTYHRWTVSKTFILKIKIRIWIASSLTESGEKKGIFLKETNHVNIVDKPVGDDEMRKIGC